MHFSNYACYSWGDIFRGIVTKKFEAGYIIICKTVSIFTNEFQWVLAVCALISVIPVWYMYRREAKHGYLMVVLFLNIAPFAMYFSGLRQALAMACIVPCYYFCKDKKSMKFVLMVIIAYFIHNSAFIIAVMYPLYHLKIKKISNLLYILPTIGIIYIYRIPFLHF